jgi:hypothetical protein
MASPPVNFCQLPHFPPMCSLMPHDINTDHNSMLMCSISFRVENIKYIKAKCSLVYSSEVL